MTATAGDAVRAVAERLLTLLVLEDEATHPGGSAPGGGAEAPAATRGPLVRWYRYYGGQREGMSTR